MSSNKLFEEEVVTGNGIPPENWKYADITVDRDFEKPHWKGRMLGLHLIDSHKYRWDLRGVWNLFWGFDIFLGRVPFLKLIILANILVWILIAKGN